MFVFKLSTIKSKKKTTNKMHLKKIALLRTGPHNEKTL